jgi:hypothetical protein
MSRAREVGLGWQSKMAATLAERDGLIEPKPEHLLVASIGTALAELVGTRWTASHDAEETETLIRAEYTRLRDVASRG